MENKSLWQTLLGTLRGMDNEGSAKRATAFFAVAFLLTSLLAVYEWSLVQAIQSSAPTQIHLTAWKYYPEIFWTIIILVLTLLGFATLELITAIIRRFTGGNSEQKKEEPKSNENA
jgi:hypothetical protein